MTHFMAYVILLSAGIAAAALLVELLLRGRTATRWTWLASLGAVVVVTGLVTFAPLPRAPETATPTAMPLTGGGTTTPLQETWIRQPKSIMRLADSILPAAWIAASAFLILAILYGQRRLLRERRFSESRTVNGHEVLLTERLGPAVAGAGRPVILLPRWVLALDARSRELLLAHEFEHVKQGDTRLLLTGAVITALMPWNPVAWWISRRLRLAVEQDCDARVLETHPDVRRYADLLLMAAGRPGVSTLLAAHFGEHRSDLDRRIQAMTDRTFKWRPTLAAATIAGVLLVASCEAPRPEPLAPRDGETALPNAAGEGGVFYEFQVEKPVTQAVGSTTPKYPDILRQAGVEGEALVSFVVNEDGTADGESFKVIRTSHELFAAAIRQALPAMKFVPAQVAGRKVKQLVQQPFTFSLPGVKSAGSNAADAKAYPRVILRDSKAGASGITPLIIVDGVIMTGSLNEIDPKSISSIEVVKGAAASRTYGPRARDGVIRITTKAGARVR